MKFAEHAALGLQHVYDTMVNHLRQQQARAVNAKGNCRYRTENGNMCAVGCLIAEDEYEHGLEMLSLENTIGYLMAGQLQPQRLKPLLWHMRQIHDDTTDVTEWELAFKDLAAHFDLEYKEPTTDV